MPAPAVPSNENACCNDIVVSCFRRSILRVVTCRPVSTRRPGMRSSTVSGARRGGVGELYGLAESLDLLAGAGRRRVWLNGVSSLRKKTLVTSTLCGTPTMSMTICSTRFGPLGMAAGRWLQKERFGGEWFPNAVEGGSGVFFAKFFQGDRDAIDKGSSCSI